MPLVLCRKFCLFEQKSDNQVSTENLYGLQVSIFLLFHESTTFEVNLSLFYIIAILNIYTQYNASSVYRRKSIKLRAPQAENSKDVVVGLLHHK